MHFSLLSLSVFLCLSQRGATPLMLACLFGNVDLVKLLLEEGADLETRDKDGWCVKSGLLLGSLLCFT
jgi:ankyrin repeat protein